MLPGGSGVQRLALSVLAGQLPGRSEFPISHEISADVIEQTPKSSQIFFFFIFIYFFYFFLFISFHLYIYLLVAGETACDSGIQPDIRPTDKLSGGPTASNPASSPASNPAKRQRRGQAR